MFYCIVTATFFFLPETYKDIEATLTEMESCMRLLLPEFSLTDIRTANEHPLDDEQPCCSKDLRDDSKEEKTQDIKESTVKERKGDEGMAEEHGSNDEEVEDDRDGNKREDKKAEMDVARGQKEDEEEESSEEEGIEPADEDLFIRNSGLISHSYSLDLNLSPGGYNSHISVNTVLLCS